MTIQKIITEINDVYLIDESFVLNPDSQKIIKNIDENGRDFGDIPITHKQYQLLCLLINEYPSFCSKQKISETLWPGYTISPESIPQLIIKTRASLKDSNKTIIINTSGKGYKLNKVSSYNQMTTTKCSPILTKKTRFNVIRTADLVLNAFVILSTLFLFVKSINFLYIYKLKETINNSEYKGLIKKSDDDINDLIIFNDLNKVCSINKITKDTSCVKEK